MESAHIVVRPTPVVREAFARHCEGGRVFSCTENLVLVGERSASQLWWEIVGGEVKARVCEKRVFGESNTRSRMQANDLNS